jgi:intraflagellar transport protein 140
MICCEAQKTRSAQAIRSPSAAAGSASTPSDSNQDSVGKDKEAEAADGDSEVEVVIFFATTENGLLMQDSFPRKSPYGGMLGLVVPRLYFRNAPTTDDDGAAGGPQDNKLKVYSKAMRDFIGMDTVDDATKVALLDFSFNLTLGKLDEAYRAVKKIGSASIWENMAQMCVKTKRLDVAEVCLGNMGHARGAAAVRESRKEGSLEVSIGVLAVHLGLLDDAARLFREANRYDLLNRLYQSAGVWDKAARVARTQDRMHLKNTYYQYAKHLESIGETDGAIENYEKSENGRIEIPRMLFTLGKMDELEDYVQRSSDPTLLKWWAAYLESTERFDKARKYYSKAGDYVSLVRIHCFKVRRIIILFILIINLILELNAW